MTAPTFITGERVAELLDMPTAIRLMREALTTLASGEARQILRPVMPLEGRNVLGLMPAFAPTKDVSGVKVLTVYPDNYLVGVPSHQGVILLFDRTTGALEAVVDAESVTAVRTAAASAAATDALAVPSASRLAILGAGLQGRQHVRAVRLVREIESIAVWDLHEDRAAAFAAEVSAETGLPTVAYASAAGAARGAHVICTVTAATEPFLTAADVTPGAHVNAVGACTPTARELSADLVAAGRMFVDWAPATVKEAGDYVLALADGAITDAHILGEVGSVLAGKLPGRASDDDITIFEALGQATEDLIAAKHVLDALRGRAGQGAGE